MSTPAKHAPTNTDIMQRLADVETGLSALTAEVDAMKQDRTWLRATMLRVLESVDGVRHGITLLSQRSEPMESDVRALRSEVASLSDMLCKRPCIVGGPDCPLGETQ